MPAWLLARIRSLSIFPSSRYPSGGAITVCPSEMAPTQMASGPKAAQASPKEVPSWGLSSFERATQ